MVDIGIVESHKENITSNSSGYRLQDLERVFSEALSSPLHPKSGSSLAQITLADDCDPLSTHLTTIKNLSMSRSFIGVNKNMIPAMEDCLSRFVSWDLYKNDMRYINLWLQYSTLSETPQRVFEYMEFLHIGWSSALFYERWANLCETAGALNKVVTLLDRGIQRQAQPLRRLEFAKNAFIERNSSINTPEESTQHVSKRNISGAASIIKAKKIKVFLDDDTSSSSEPEVGNINSEPHARTFPYISLENRENKAPVQPLNGQVLIQSRAPTPPASRRESLFVFRDAENEEEIDQEYSATKKLDSSHSEYVSHKLKLIEVRQYSTPLREFNPTPNELHVNRMTNYGNATGFIGKIEPTLADVLYAHHAGYTERVPDNFDPNPPTEQLQ